MYKYINYAVCFDRDRVRVSKCFADPCAIVLRDIVKEAKTQMQGIRVRMCAEMKGASV